MNKECPTCESPIHDAGTLCNDCTRVLADDLRALTEVARELGVTLTRQARTGDGDGGIRTQGTVQPLPFNEGASQVLVDMRASVRGWVKQAGGRETDGLAWLQGRVGWIRLQDWGPSLATGVERVRQRGERVTDRRASPQFMGPCPTCEEDLYAREGQSNSTCGNCGSEWLVEERRTALQAATEDYLAPAQFIAKSVSWLVQEEVTAHRIMMMARRGKMHVKGHVWVNGQLRPTYRVGDVIELVKAAQQRSDEVA